MLELLVRLVTPPTARERDTALGAMLGVQAGVAVLRITRSPELAAAAAAIGAAAGTYVGAYQDLVRFEAELASINSTYY